MLYNIDDIEGNSEITWPCGPLWSLRQTAGSVWITSNGDGTLESRTQPELFSVFLFYFRKFDMNECADGDQINFENNLMWPQNCFILYT